MKNQNDKDKLDGTRDELRCKMRCECNQSFRL